MVAQSTMKKIRTLLLGTIATFASAAAPENDKCTDATVISTLPFEQGGNVVNATLDEWSIDCGFNQVPAGNGVWYAVEDFAGGTRLTAICKYMNCMLMTTNATRGECPSKFLCAGASVGVEGDEIRYTWTAQEGGIYYIYIAPKRNVPGPFYELTVRESTSPPTIPPATTSAPQPSPPVSSAFVRFSWGAMHCVLLVMTMYFLR